MTPAPLGVQLYSVRDDLSAAALPGTVARLAGMGFTNLEPFRILENTEELRDAMAEHGLVATTAHANVLTLDRPAHLAAARTLGIETLIIPWTEPESLRDAEGVQRLIDGVNDAARWAADNGLRLGYHNHDFEFSIDAGGISVWERLVAEAHESVVFELDTYWASVGGGDVFEILPRLGERIPFLHVKNEPPDPWDPEPLGVDITGRMDEILRLATSLELPVVEIVVDEGDVFPVLERNADWFRRELAEVTP